jgi:putative ABC transport system substrate-binding protein
MVNVGNPADLLEMNQAQAAAQTVGIEVTAAEVRRAEDIPAAIDALNGKIEALYVASDALFNNNRARINNLALGMRLPTVGGSRNFVLAGGLMAYGPNYPDLFRRTADYVDKILRGTDPREIPVKQPTKFEFVVNLATAKALELEVPRQVLALADEVIE